MHLRVAAYNATLRLNLLAIDYNGSGEVIPAELWVAIPGFGVFSAEPVGMVGEDTVLSARIALYYASLLVGLKPDNIDAGFSILEGGSVSGASAGLAFLAGYYSLLHGVFFNTSAYAFTGLIAPNGMVYAVGGVAAKVAAAKTVGISIVVVPWESETLNMSSSGVYRVCSFADVIERLYGVNIDVQPTLNDTLFCDAATTLMRMLNEVLDKLPELRDNTTLSRLVASMRLREEGRCYSAASVAYSALVALLERSDNAARLIMDEALALSNREVFGDKLYALKTHIERSDRVDLWKLEALLSSLYRFYAASHLLTEKDIKLRALGALRLLTASQWLEVAEKVEGPAVDARVVKNAARMLIDYALISYKYLESLVKGHRVPIENAEHLRLKRIIDDMQAAYTKGDYLEAMALALQALDTIDNVMLSYGIAMCTTPAGHHACIAIFYRCAYRQYALNTIYSGVESLVGKLLVEYAQSVNSSLSKAVIMDDAASYTLLMLAIRAAMQNHQVSLSRATGAEQHYALVAAALGAAFVVGGVGSAALLAKKIE